MSQPIKREATVIISSDLGLEKIPIAAAAIISRKMGFTSDRIESLKMAVGEAVTNAIEHGNQLDLQAEVRVNFTELGHKLTIDVIDQGQQPIPDIPTERQEREDNRGWGMLLIKGLVDEVSVSATSGRNRLRMVLYRD